jgi:hypothetical protein
LISCQTLGVEQSRCSAVCLIESCAGLRDMVQAHRLMSALNERGPGLQKLGWVQLAGVD